MNPPPKKPLYHPLEVDEEGFPLVDGLRIDDADLCRELFSSLKREGESEPRSVLLSTYGGHPVRVDAFDAPLVAQQIHWIDEKSCEWIFPGDYREMVKLDDILVDPWHRLHAWIGKINIPGVMSRKAQAAFLGSLKSPESFKPGPFRVDESGVNASNRWDEMYTGGGDGWELGRVAPALVGEFDAFQKQFPGLRTICVPGAGRGHEADFFAQKKYSVTALDFSPEAVSEFSRLYPDSRVEYLSEDLFEYFGGRSENFDAVFEYTIFCAIDPARRTEYLKCLAQCLKKDGLYFGAFLVHTAPGGPPYGLTQWELREMTQDRFRVLEWKISGHSHPKRLGNELWAVLQKKSL